MKISRRDTSLPLRKTAQCPLNPLTKEDDTVTLPTETFSYACSGLPVAQIRQLKSHEYLIPQAHFEPAVNKRKIRYCQTLRCRQTQKLSTLKLNEIKEKLIENICKEEEKKEQQMSFRQKTVSSLSESPDQSSEFYGYNISEISSFDLDESFHEA